MADSGGREPGRSFDGMPEPPPIPEELRRPVERPASMRANDRGPSATMKAASGYASAFTFIGTVLGCAAIGWLIDLWLDTSPWGVTVCLGLGFVGATWRLVREMSR